MRSDDLGTRTPISGLLLAGQDTAGPGIEAAFMSGLMAAAHVDPALWQTLRSQSLRSSDGNGQRKR
jgi:all-trans-retinol 13,14-reductase